MMIPFASMTAAGRSRTLSAERLVNLYAEAAPPGARGPMVLRSTPGLSHWTTVGQGPVRGMHVMAGALYVVSGAVLYRLDEAGNGTSLGAIPGTGPAGMADNGQQLVVLNRDGDAWVWDGAALAQITDPDFRPAGSCAFLNHYIVFAAKDSGQFFTSALLDAKSYEALDFASAEARPDAIVQLFAFNNAIWLFGERTTEVWWNTGAAGFPFERVSGGVIEIGCVADSVATVDASVYWLGDDGMVYKATGYRPQRVSSHAVEHRLRGRTGIRAWAYKEEGHAFYVLGSDQGALVYDAATGLWHERESFTFGRWRADSHVRFAGRQLVGDFLLGRIYEMSPDNHSDGDKALQRRAVTPPVHADGAPTTMAALQVEFDHGVGLTAGQGSDPQVVLDWSDDGGRRWSGERWAAIGRIGEYRRRAVWRRLGGFRSRAFRLTYSEPTPFTIQGVDP